MNFKAFENDIIENKWNVFGVEVYKKGELIHSYGDTDKKLHEIYSATKTVLSLAVGIAYDEGLFDLNRSFIDYIPSEKVSKLPAAQKEVFKLITIERLLTMSVAGFPFRPAGKSWLDFSLSRKIEKPKERIFNYSNICAYLTGVALTEALSSDSGKFIEEKILSPLEITRYEYQRCPDGYFYGASGMKLTVHDLSKIGMLLYNKGTAGGKQLLSEKYVEAATSVKQINKEGGYGYFIWKYRNGFSINGKWKQKCYVLPEEELMISFLSHIEDDSVNLIGSMEKNILGI